jgi:integrase
MASFEKRKGGWLARVRKAGISQSLLFRTKAEAKAWASRIEADISVGKAGQAANKSFGELIEHYIEKHVAKLDGAREDTCRLARVLKEPIAKVRLADLDATHVAQWRDKRLERISSESVRREWSSLSHACEIAIREWRWLTSNPFREVQKPAKALPRTRRVSDDEIERIMLACGYDYDMAPQTAMARTGAAFLFAIETAMRAGEICALERKDIDMEKRVAHIAAVARGARKNKRGRVVPLSQEALRILKQLLPVAHGDRVFGLEPRILDPLFRKAKSRALITGLHFHDTRREALTRMAAKVDVLTLAKISGHQDLRILQSVYYAPDMSGIADRLG